ncbi:Substrate adaptor for cullin 3 ubiquitin ligase Btb3 [Phytophthora megakarya]|uniref:Substrate adaptor for cullin 3 ubiquitin ligase Btb3 n=1 Tax=Phytophthora megakarya TaxID=4795 RepID=A0A225VKN5_9STRA|nr:Substrate adaptor for cullin 3 ubiquitin ligase Btb3 [Phytophthora megakarya]
MGNAAAIHNVAESSRRRLLLQQYNRQPRNVLVRHSLMQAFEQRRYQSLQPQKPHSFRRDLHTDVGKFSMHKEPLQSLPLLEIYDVLKIDFGVQLTLEELPTVLRHLGCRVVDSPTNSDPNEEWYSLQGLMGYVAPRRVLRQVKRPLECPHSSEFSHNNVTIWQAAKMGNLEVLKAVCKAHHTAYRALDDFDNSPLYYASLCGREVAVDFILSAYEEENLTIQPDELLRCVTNALNQPIRALLQHKTTLGEILKSKDEGSECDENTDDDDAGGAWFGLLASDNDEDE